MTELLTYLIRKYESTKFSTGKRKIAENQEEYETLPAHIGGKSGEVTICFELDRKERKQVQETGQIWLSVLTFNSPLQPIHQSCLKPKFKKYERI